MEFFILGLIIGILAYLTFTYYRRYKISTKIIKNINQTIQELKSVVVPCRLEFDDDVIFVYRKDNGLFLAKGTSFEEVEQILARTYPEKLFDVDSEEIIEAKVISKINERKSNVSAS
jgi:hypothetical protein